MQQVNVASTQAMNSTITSYVAQGFVVANQTETSATLQKAKKFNAASLLLILIPFLGWIAFAIYLVVFAIKPAAQVIEVRTSEAATPVSHSSESKLS